MTIRSPLFKLDFSTRIRPQEIGPWHRRHEWDCNFASTSSFDPLFSRTPRDESNMDLAVRRKKGTRVTKKGTILGWKAAKAAIAAIELQLWTFWRSPCDFWSFHRFPQSLQPWGPRPQGLQGSGGIIIGLCVGWMKRIKSCVEGENKGLGYAKSIIIYPNQEYLCILYIYICMYIYICIRIYIYTAYIYIYIYMLYLCTPIHACIPRNQQWSSSLSSMERTAGCKEITPTSSNRARWQCGCPTSHGGTPLIWMVCNGKYH